MIKEINKDHLPVIEEFYSIQGEGFHTGAAAYFIRLGGCDIGCNWCDTKFSWNPEIHGLTSVADVLKRANEVSSQSLIVTGGEPLMYNLKKLCEVFHSSDYKTFLETSGAYQVTGSWDWFCLSPKKQKPPLNESYQMANELKVIIQNKKDFEWAEECARKVKTGTFFYLQPEWSAFKHIVPEIVNYILEHPKWNISLQSHKFMRIP